MGRYKGYVGIGFPTIRGTIVGDPIVRIIIFWGLYWGPPILGTTMYVHLCGHMAHVATPLLVCNLGIIKPAPTATRTVKRKTARTGLGIPNLGKP